MKNFKNLASRLHYESVHQSYKKLHETTWHSSATQHHIPPPEALEELVLLGMRMNFVRRITEEKNYTTKTDYVKFVAIAVTSR